MARFPPARWRWVTVFVLLVLFGAREAIGPVGGGLSAAPANAETCGGCTASRGTRWRGNRRPRAAVRLSIAMLATVIGGSVPPRCRRSCCWPSGGAVGSVAVLRVVGPERRGGRPAGCSRWRPLLRSQCQWCVGDGRWGSWSSPPSPWLGHAPWLRARSPTGAGGLRGVRDCCWPGRGVHPVAWFFAAAGAALVGVGFVIARPMRDRSV